MADLQFDGMALGEGVVETIIAIALQNTEGVTLVGSTTPAGLLGSLATAKPATGGIEVDVEEANALHVAVHVAAEYGFALPDLAARVRSTVADAILSQVGIEVSSVDVYIDSISF